MTRPQRIAAFAVSAFVVLSAVVVLARTTPQHERARDDAARAAAPARPTIQDGTETAAAAPSTTPAPEDPGVDEDLPIGTEVPPAPTRRDAAAERHARAFLAVFLRYEVGDLGPDVRAAIGRLCDARLGGDLLGAPPRQPGVGVQRPAVLVGVDSVDPAFDGEGTDVHVTVERDGRQTPLVVTVERRDGRWQTTAVG